MRIPIAKERTVNAIKSIVKRYPLITFFVLAYLFTWLGWLVPERVDRSTLLGWIAAGITFPLMAGPLLSALLVTAITDGKAGLVALLRKFTIWRVGWGWWAVALLVGPVIGLTAAYANVLFGAPDPTALLLASWTGILTVFAVRLVFPFDGPMQEELGWRGYALPHIQERYPALVANLILGVLVAGWHLPLVFMGKLPLFALIGTVGATIVFGWIYNNTGGSVLMVLIAHAADGLVRADFVGADLTRFFIFYVAAWWVVVLTAVILHGPDLVRKPAMPTATTRVGQPLAAK
jgi:membrane protease YdiL (CAAX protease family)